MSLINTQAPQWQGTAYWNNEFVEVSSKACEGKWYILFFYPADFTFVCPTELEDMQKHYAEFKEMGVEVYSVSTDKHFSHMAWHDSSPRIGKIEYPMLGDPTRKIAKDFKVLRETKDAADRATILVDPDGVIQYIEITSEGVGRNAAELVRKVKAAQYVREHPDQVCPASWEEGEGTIQPGINMVGVL